ncbi:MULTISPECIES: YdeI/OmpD-associated family protein [Clostridium]|uniref:DUF1905 domain-containing protein n=1 Tax=Clostridium cibarium TaxID=2762247 RepID=A0ABR8PX68_9CLOT|nr:MULTISPECIES: YdeI/OmpD-associated family protein [Clostridium]MBD7912751.1 DUF1905 domain-containing protein [Clostridium cibarium]
MERFEAEIKEVIGRGGAYVEIPFNVEEVYGAKRVKVKATFDDTPYRGSIVKMGTECHIIGITKEIRNKINKDIGDRILVTVEKDEEERVVEIPEEFKEKIDSEKEALEFWNELSFSNKKKYVNWVYSAKREETRNKRIEIAIEKLINKEKL